MRSSWYSLACKFYTKGRFLLYISGKRQRAYTTNLQEQAPSCLVSNSVCKPIFCPCPLHETAALVLTSPVPKSGRGQHPAHIPTDRCWSVVTVTVPVAAGGRLPRIDCLERSPKVQIERIALSFRLHRRPGEWKTVDFAPVQEDNDGLTG
jgi:hypothetical protein